MDITGVELGFAEVERARDGLDAVGGGGGPMEEREVDKAPLDVRELFKALPGLGVGVSLPSLTLITLSRPESEVMDEGRGRGTVGVPKTEESRLWVNVRAAGLAGVDPAVPLTPIRRLIYETSMP